MDSTLISCFVPFRPETTLCISRSLRISTPMTPHVKIKTSEIAVLDHITFIGQWWLCIPPAVTFSDAAMTPTQFLYGFRSVLRIKRDCFPLYNRSSKQSYSVEERNKICKQHSASCLNGVNRISVPKNGRLHEALTSLHGIILCNVKTWQPLIRFVGICRCSMWARWWREYRTNTSVR